MPVKTAVTADELSERTEQILRRVRDEGEAVEILEHGRIVARLVPFKQRQLSQAEIAARLERLDRLAEEIGAQWPEGVTVEEAINDVRRDL